MEEKQNIIKTISDEKKVNYLSFLDNSIDSIIRGFELGQTRAQTRFIKEFAEVKNWDMDRLPAMDFTYANISELMTKVRNEYKILAWDDRNEDPLDNKGYFENINIDSRVGLPCVYDFMDLKKLLETRVSKLQTRGSYDELLRQLHETLMTDDVDLTNVTKTTKKIHKDAMKRNFLELIEGYNQISCLDYRVNSEFNVRKIKDFGSEDLWNISYIRYSKSHSMFEAYTIDLWQDNIAPQISENEGENILTDNFKGEITNFSIENPAWYVIRRIDKKFESMHPVHVSKCILGPYENIYLSNPRFQKLQFAENFINENPNEGLLRFSRSYSYAPNQISIDSKPNQEIYQENWSDEIIACPSHYSSNISREILGTNVRVVEI